MFPKKDWLDLNEEEQEYYLNLTKEQLIERWESEEGKEIIKK